MRIEELPERSLTGITVESHFDELRTRVPAAWRRIAESGSSRAARYAELSTELGAGRYREVLGLLGTGNTLDPSLAAETVTVPVPGGSWVTTVHDGPEPAIAETFGAMLEWAASQGFEPTGEKTDVGYRLDGANGPHELGIRVRRRP